MGTDDVERDAAWRLFLNRRFAVVLLVAVALGVGARHFYRVAERSHRNPVGEHYKQAEEFDEGGGRPQGGDGGP